MAADGSAAPRDLTAEGNFDVPPDEAADQRSELLGQTRRDLFTAVTDPIEAISTNGDLVSVLVAGGEAKRIDDEAGHSMAVRRTLRMGNISHITRS